VKALVASFDREKNLLVKNKRERQEIKFLLSFTSDVKRRGTSKLDE